MEAKRHMQDGIACIEQCDWEDALTHFDRAAALREATPWREDPASAWLLAAAWMNRADVLRFLGRTAEAIPSLDRALDAMRHVPLDVNPGHASRLILARINRATSCGDTGRFHEALGDFSKAAALLEIHGTRSTPERRLLSSMLHANRARVFLHLGRIREARTDAGIAIGFLDGLEPCTSVAEAAIKARGTLCRALAMQLDEPDGLKLEEDWIAGATDATEEALSIVRASGYRGAWLADLVRYGARIYRTCQPHFLGEYLHEWAFLAGDNDLRREMRHEVLLAKAALEQRVRLHAHETDLVERAMNTLSSLQAADRAWSVKSLPLPR